MKGLIYKLLLLIPLVISNVCHSTTWFELGNFELYYSLFLIILLGIPHGAMDHIIFKKEKKEVSHLFTLFYWALGLSNAVLWFFFPLEITSFFILLSAFHFGEGQFSKNEYLNGKPFFLICWGMTAIALLLSKNIDQLAEYVKYYDNPVFYQQVLMYLEQGYVFIGFLILTIIQKVYFLVNKKLSLSFFIKEASLFSIVLIFMNYSTLIVGVTTFFVFVHSLSVLEQEYQYLKGDNPSFSLIDFVKIIFPFSFLSYLMVGIFLLLNIYGIIQISNTYLLLVILSSLTLPHAVVMHIFYNTGKPTA